MAGYASLCGTLIGASAAIEYAFPPKIAKNMIRRLFRWYEITPFPTEEANEYAVKGKFYTKGKTNKALPSIVGGSVLCHVIVSRWCVATGYASGSKERSERCSRIAAAVAKQTVLLMNAALKGGKKGMDKVFPFKLSDEVKQCRICHFKGKNYAQGQFSRGFMECEACHNINVTEHTLLKYLSKGKKE